MFFNLAAATGQPYGKAVIRGWLTDHNWFPLAVCLLLAGALNRSLSVDLGNPFGDSYANVNSSIVLCVLGTASCVVALRSDVSTGLSVDTTPWMRAAWGALILSTQAIIVLLLRGPDWPPIVVVIGLNAGVACLAMMVADERAGLVYCFVCFAACLLSPAGAPRPWWNPLLGTAHTHWRTGVAVAALGAVMVAYASGRRRRRF